MVLLYRAIIRLINLIELLILIRIIFSFLNIGGKNIITRLVYDLTEPILAPARNLIYKLGIRTGMFDFSPIIAVLFLRVLSSFVLRRLI